MRPVAIQNLLCLIAAGLLGCGGGTAEQPITARTDTPVPEEAGPVDTPPEPQRDEPERQPAPVVQPAPPPIEPVRASTADELRAAILAASHGEAALRRLIDPAWGIGTYDTSTAGSGIGHHCDADEVGTVPGAAFSVQEDDRWACDRDLRRCQASSSDGGGYVFHFRAGSGNVVWLSAVIHHNNGVPSRDSAAVNAFMRNGDGVCTLWRAITDAQPHAPNRFSVFVGRHTGLVPELLRQHLCGAEAQQAFTERSQTVPRGQTFSCTRNPARCSLRSGDEEYTYYGDTTGITALAITRHSMFPNLEREQQRDVDGFLRDLRGHHCD